MTADYCRKGFDFALHASEQAAEGIAVAGQRGILQAGGGRGE